MREGNHGQEFPTNPSHPERICWDCNLYCPTKALACGNGASRTMHPVELFGEDWVAPTGDRATYQNLSKAVAPKGARRAQGMRCNCGSWLACDGLRSSM